jgi:isoquinoline 1-oxidoreductase beta subunit
MTRNNTASTRRSFLKVSALAGDGMLFGIGWFSDSYAADMPATSAAGLEGGELNGYVKITPDNVIRIMCPNPEGGQNVKTSMPMIVAEELDVDWKDVVVEQAPLNTDRYTRQFIGGSQAIHRARRGSGLLAQPEGRCFAPQPLINGKCQLTRLQPRLAFCITK